MDKLNVERTHQEAEQGAIHARALTITLTIQLSEELVNEAANCGLEDRFTHAHDRHDDARSNRSQVVRVEPAVQLFLEAIVRCQSLIGHLSVRHRRAVEDEVGEAEIGQPRQDVGRYVEEVASDELLAHFR